MYTRSQYLVVVTVLLMWLQIFSIVNHIFAFTNNMSVDGSSEKVTEWKKSAAEEEDGDREEDVRS